MPTYQYACTNPQCGNRFELVQSFSDPSISACPACQQPVRKVYGSVGVVFKGSGFYRNDSRSDNGRSPGGRSEDGGRPDDGRSENGKKAAAESGSAGKTDTPSSTPSETSAPTASTGAKSPAAAVS
jgi:putative FmdB family regulatory protein